MPVDAPDLPPVSTDAPPAPVGLLPRRTRPSLRPPNAGPNPLRRLFWMAFAGLILLVGVKSPGQTPESLFGAVIIITAAMLPAYLWINGKVRGLPLFPACALSCTWTFAVPLVSEHPIIVLFPGWNQLVAALSVAGFLLIGTLTWYLVARRAARPPSVCYRMDERLSRPLLLTALAICALYTVAAAAGLLRLPGGTDSVVRAGISAIEAMACFILGYELGAGRMPAASKIAFFVLLGLLLVATLPTLLLIAAMCLLAITLMGYVVASNRLPWRLCLAMLCMFGYLHVGKGAMREKYWHEEEKPTFTPFQYPAFIFEWVQTSAHLLWHGNSQDEASESLLERASLMHWLLYFQAVTPANVPFLNGETYAVIPRLFVPRMFDPEKPSSQEATYVLAIHYGIQTREDTETTTIAFGLLSEAYANFGFLGLGGLGIVLGAFYGQVAYWACRMPLLSFRGLFAILIASFSFQAEAISTNYAAALFQSTIVLVILAMVFMRARPTSSAQLRLSY